MNSEPINNVIDYEAKNKVLEEENDKLKLQFTEVRHKVQIYYFFTYFINFSLKDVKDFLQGVYISKNNKFKTIPIKLMN